MNFFTKSIAGNLFFASIIHGLFYIILKLMYEFGAFKKIFYEIFGVASFTKIVTYNSFIGNAFKVNDFSMKLWLDYFLYRYSIICLLASFVFTVIFLFLYSSRKSGDNLTPTWNSFAIILLVLSVLFGIAYTPIISSVGLMIFSYLVYFCNGFLPFYITTLILSGTTAFQSYALKKRFG